MIGPHESQSTLVLLATSRDLDRLVLEADLVNRGYRVFAAQNVEEALRIVRSESLHVLITDLVLSGGGGFSLCRGAKKDRPEMPCIALSHRPVDSDIRQMGRRIGLESFIEAPFCMGQITAQIDHVLSHQFNDLQPDIKGSIQGKLSSWTPADLIVLVHQRQWTATITLTQGSSTADIHTREGALTNARLHDLYGEKALAKCLDWNSGAFTLRVEPQTGPSTATVRPPRNIHRGTAEVLTQILSEGTAVERQIRDLSNGTLVHRIDHKKLKPNHSSPEFIEQLDKLLDGTRTLQEALRAIDSIDRKTLKLVHQLLRNGGLQNVDEKASKALKTQPKLRTKSSARITVEPPYDERFEANQIVQQGRTFRRKLSFNTSGKSVSDLIDVDIQSDTRHTRMRQYTFLALGTLMLLATVAMVIYLISASPESEVEVHVIEDDYTSDKMTAKP